MLTSGDYGKRRHLYTSASPLAESISLFINRPTRSPTSTARPSFHPFQHHEHLSDDNNKTDDDMIPFSPFPSFDAIKLRHCLINGRSSMYDTSVMAHYPFQPASRNTVFLDYFAIPHSKTMLPWIVYR